ncbi:hypothetical protein SARC_06441 [Sphaeroforma arctica JP610]|uniref:GRIP domain-containing protein n=1 Tax=Sphaeroforma arctica JP610 TaxID=667725 RepID=A0A0L0FX63_9EUKA|nr:hypothetical protein SARC_06441 [Sphaeroforma arctica JP610]KNC81229.1 hypothetical protein SARC_06441 [Sphaeroforma arctica JP610]|eukprot:XP_014155131.1 hypothetical protein SARC_06441 [Sphaeroforma arctica JP610]
MTHIYRSEHSDMNGSSWHVTVHFSDWCTLLFYNLRSLYEANSRLRTSVGEHEQKEKDRQQLEARLQAMSVELARAQLQRSKTKATQSRTSEEIDALLKPIQTQLENERALVKELQQEIEDLKTDLDEAKEECMDLKDQLRASEQAVERLHTQEELLRDMLRRAEEASNAEQEPLRRNTPQMAATDPTVSNNLRTPSTQSQTIDLERLLSYNTANTPPGSPQTAQRNPSFGNPNQYSQAMQKKREELEVAQKTITHLRELVSDLESSGMRMEEQQRVLKEEIRRLERNAARNEAFNLEYLKKVLLSFLEAQEEKTRKPFLMVFAQMLKFSPEEMEKLNESYNVFETRNRYTHAPSLLSYFSSSTT